MYKLLLSLAILLTALLIPCNHENNGLVMKTYSSQYASEGRLLRGVSRSRRSSRGSSSYSSYKSPTYGSAYYIPVAYHYTYRMGYYLNRPN